MACNSANSSATASKKTLYKVDSYPAAISNTCRNGIAKIYDECGSQTVIFEQALQRANATGKSLMIVYGAEWCIWCHVFDKYVKGESEKFNYEWEYDGEIETWDMNEGRSEKARTEAAQLNKYVADNFVIAHIEGQYAPDGLSVIDAIGFDSDKIKFYPFIFSIANSGKYADHMLASDAIPGLEIRSARFRSYRGFERTILLRELVALREAAVASQ